MEGLAISSSPAGVKQALPPLEQPAEQTILAADEFEDMCDEEEEIDICDDGSQLDSETNRFDRVVGALEDVLVDDAFAEQRESFCRANCHHFEPGEENKLVYTELFARYTALVEAGVAAGLAAALPGFDMESFLALVDAHQEELGAEVFDLLLSMADFASFKQLMLAYRVEVEAGEGGLMGGAVQVASVHIHAEEQEEGEERPDLDDGLSVVRSPR